MTIYIVQNYLLLTYDHDIIYKWFAKNFPKNIVSPESLDYSQKRNDVCTNYNKNSLIEKVMNNICISGWIDFQHILANIRLNDQNSSVGFNRFRIIVDQDQNKRGEIHSY